MIAGDWPNGAGRNLIKSPPRTGLSPSTLSTVPTCAHIIHSECIINASRIRGPPSARRHDLISEARAHACTDGAMLSETQRPKSSRGASRPKQNIRSITIVNHQDSRYSLNGHFAVHRMQAGAPLPIRVAGR